MRYALIACVAASTAALACLPLAAAQAEPILYTETTTASGTLGGKSFNNRPLTVYYLGDTSTIINPAPGLIEETGGIAGFRLSSDDDGKGVGIFTGGGAATLLFPSLNTFVIGANSTNPNLNPPGSVGPGARSSGVVLGLNSPGLAGYTLHTAIGPIKGPGVIQSDPSAGSNGVPATFASTAGDLLLTKVGTVKLRARLLKDTGEVERDLQDN